MTDTTQTRRGRSIELYFIDGRPDGMLTAEDPNWTGHVLKAPRTQLAKALARPEARRTGAYLLLGETENGPTAYIGESDDVSDRIRSHDQTKDWWEELVITTSSSNQLNKAHVRYLEARLIEFAHEAKRVHVENRARPSPPPLNEAATANMEVFLERLLVILPAIRVDMFVNRTGRARKALESPQVQFDLIFELRNPKTGVMATATLEDGDFIVRAGSRARLHWAGKGASAERATYRPLYDELKRTGVLQEQGAYSIFTQPYAFKAPSAAAAVVQGRTANGRVEWKVQKTGVTYKDWEASQVTEGSD